MNHKREVKKEKVGIYLEQVICIRNTSAYTVLLEYSCLYSSTTVA